MEEKSTEAKTPQTHIIISGSRSPWNQSVAELGNYSQEVSLPASLAFHASVNTNFYDTGRDRMECDHQNHSSVNTQEHVQVSAAWVQHLLQWKL